MTSHLDEPDRLKPPLMVEVEGVAEADPGAAPPPPEPGRPQGRAMQALGRRAGGRWGPWARFSAAVFSSLIGLMAGVAGWNFLTGLLAANAWLGWLATGLMAAALVIALVWALGEILAYWRLERLGALRQQAAAALAAHDLGAARQVLGRLAALYARRGDLAWARARLAERQGEVMDADALLALAETELMAPLDAQALEAVQAAARQVALVTAFVPLALADLATALVANLGMLRRVAQIYGGRAGTLGSWVLMRQVFLALMAAGALALTDDLLGSVAGGGVLSRLSRRFGEGLVNGALTARVGLAAIEMCRPLPFAALERPGASATVARALAGLVGPRGPGGEAAGGGGGGLA